MRPTKKGESGASGGNPFDLKKIVKGMTRFTPAGVAASVTGAALDKFKGMKGETSQRGGRFGTSSASASGAKATGGDRFARAGAVAPPKAPEKSKMGDFGVKPRVSKNYAMDKAPRRKPVTGVSSGSIDKPNNKAAQKSRDDLGAFYLNATSGMDIFSRNKPKKK